MGDFDVHRSTTINADVAAIHGLINDFREWTKWSPWEDIDPNLDRTYSGADAGVGAKYSWSGNRKAGVGRMEITGSDPHQVAIRLEFDKPFKATNNVTFQLSPAKDGTDVTWRMTGTQKGLMAIFGKLWPMDKLVGKDFEKGLAQLKAAAEAPG
jgi:hypothetical protein